MRHTHKQTHTHTHTERQTDLNHNMTQSTNSVTFHDFFADFLLISFIVLLFFFSFQCAIRLLFINTVSSFVLSMDIGYFDDTFAKEQKSSRRLDLLRLLFCLVSVAKTFYFVFKIVVVTTIAFRFVPLRACRTNTAKCVYCKPTHRNTCSNSNQC